MKPKLETKNLSFNRFATLWMVECTWERTPGYTHHITIYEPMETTLKIPRNARPHCSSWETTFYDVTGNKRLGTVRHCETAHNSSPSVCLINDGPDGTWYEFGCGEIRYVHGRWHVVREAWNNSRVARMMNAGWKAYKE